MKGFHCIKEYSIGHWDAGRREKNLGTVLDVLKRLWEYLKISMGCSGCQSVCLPDRALHSSLCSDCTAVRATVLLNLISVFHVGRTLYSECAHVVNSSEI